MDSDTPESLIPYEQVQDSVRRQLERYLADEKLTAETGAQMLSNVLIHQDEAGKQTIVPLFYEFWEAFLPVVYETAGGKLKRLADLTTALSELNAGIATNRFGHKIRVWESMPNFEWTIDDQMCGLDDAKEPGRTHKRWDFRRHGLGAIVAALECDQDLDYWIPIAAPWIDLHGESFLGAGWNTTRDFDPRGVQVASGPLREGGCADMSKERWDFWTGRLEDLQASDKTSAETKAIANQMAEHMAEITKDLKSSDEEDDSETEDDIETVEKETGAKGRN